MNPLTAAQGRAARSRKGRGGGGEAVVTGGENGSDGVTRGDEQRGGKWECPGEGTAGQGRSLLTPLTDRHTHTAGFHSLSLSLALSLSLCQVASLPPPSPLSALLPPSYLLSPHPPHPSPAPNFVSPRIQLQGNSI